MQTIFDGVTGQSSASSSNGSVSPSGLPPSQGDPSRRWAVVPSKRACRGPRAVRRMPVRMAKASYPKWRAFRAPGVASKARAASSHESAMTLRLPRRAALLSAAIAPFAVAFLGSAPRPADSPAPALACTGMPTVLAFPAGTDVPVNATLRMLSSGETLEVRPSDGLYELRGGGTPVAVDARTMDGSVELLPKARLTAGTAVE